MGVAAIMGWRPSEAKQETPFDLWAAWIKFSRYHSGEPEHEPMTRGELSEILKSYNPNGK